MEKAKKVSLLKKAIKKLSKAESVEDVSEVLKYCFRVGDCDVPCISLFASAIAFAVDDQEVAHNFITGPCPSPQWGGTGEGAIAELETVLSDLSGEGKKKKKKDKKEKTAKKKKKKKKRKE